MYLGVTTYDKACLETFDGAVAVVLDSVYPSGLELLATTRYHIWRPSLTLDELFDLAFHGFLPLVTEARSHGGIIVVRNRNGAKHIVVDAPFVVSAVWVIVGSNVSVDVKANGIRVSSPVS